MRALVSEGMRRRVLLLIILTFVGMFIINFAAARLVIFASFTSLERQYVERDVSRFQNILSDDLGDLRRTAANYGEREETRRFVANPRGMWEPGLTESAFAIIRVELVVVLDRAGKAISARAAAKLDARGERAITDLEAYLSGHADILQRARAGVPVAGIALLPSGPFFLAVHPVSGGAAASSYRGSLVFGRALDAEEVTDIGDRLRLSVTLFPPDAPQTPADVRGALAKITEREPVYVAPLDRRTVAGYSLVRDLEGDPILIARVVAPRDILAQAGWTLWYIFVSLAAIALVVGGVVLLFLEKVVISRVHSLSSSLLRIGTSQDLSLRTVVRGRDQLAYLAAAINGMLETVEKSTAALRASEARNEAFLAAFPDLLFRLKRDGTLLDYRWPGDAPYRKLPPGLVGSSVRSMPDVYPVVGREAVERALASIDESAATGAPVVFEFPSESDGVKRIFEARVVAVGPDEAIALVRDVTAQKTAQEAERKEILLKEIHHRVKNNLQVISSLLDLQARAAQDPATARILQESKDRVRSMSLIHEKLYMRGGAEGVRFSEYVRDLTARLCDSFACAEQGIGVELDVEDLTLDMDTSVPLGIIINELLTNALKYAYPDGGKGRILISMHAGEDGMLQLSVRDDGAGFPAHLDYRYPATLGLRIVNTLASQLHGELTMETGRGTVFTVSFPQPSRP